VDADGDGERNPQDIDDAALATAVYLCSGADDLSTGAGQRSAVLRYNHSASYVDLVLSIMNAYLDGEFTSVPNGTTSAGYLVPAPVQPGPVRGSGHGHGQGHQEPHGTQTEPPTTTPTQQPTQEPTEQPSNPVNPGGGGGGGGLPHLPTPSVPPLPTTSIPPVDETLTKAEALAQCVADGVVDNPLTSVNELVQCVEKLLG
jgi:hypothetical protein